MKKFKKRILIVGSGDIALRAIPWLARRFHVLALIRRPETAAHLRTLGVTPLPGNLDSRSSLIRYAGIADAILHCAPPPGEGTRDQRTRNLLAALACRRSLPQRMVYISTTGVYGNQAGKWVDENTPLRPQSLRAQRRVDAESVLRAFGIRTRTTITFLRAPGIYAADRLPLERLRRQDPVLHADEDSYTNHIHADDLAYLTCLALFRGRPGRAINATDDSDIQMGAWFDAVADTFHLPRPPRQTRQEIVQHLSPAMQSFMNESRRIKNHRMKHELRARLRYPTISDGLHHAARHHSLHT